MNSIRQSISLAPLLLLLPLLAGCGSSSSDAPRAESATADDRRLVHVDSASVVPAIKPHHTVVISRPPEAEDGDSGYQDLPYEILNAGSYKFCVPEDDSHIDRVELLDPANQEVARWVKGEECQPVRLDPGTYTMHIHHVIDDHDPLLFIKPHAVMPIAGASVASAAVAAASYNTNIPAHQFVDSFADHLFKVVRHNSAKSTLNPAWVESWGLTVKNTVDSSWDDLKGYIHLEGSSYWSDRNWVVDSINFDDRSKFVVHEVVVNDPSTFVQYVVFKNMGYPLLSKSFDGKTVLGTPNIPMLSPGNFKYAYFWQVPQNDQNIFSLERYPANIFQKHSVYRGGKSSDGHYVIEEVTDWSGSLNFNIKVRTGKASGTSLPVLLPGNIALFDQCYGANGFSEPANYWIFHESSTDFNDLLSPAVDKVHSVMAAPGLRARLYAQPNMQGGMQWVSPPHDKAMIMTCTDAPLLNDGTVKSIYVDSGPTDNISSYEYEHHIVVSASTCVGCNLNGFTFKEGLKLNNLFLAFCDLTNAQFSGLTIGGKANFFNSHLNGADLSGVSCPDGCAFQGSRMENADLSNANLAKAEFYKSQLRNADFTGANLQGAVFLQAALDGTKFQKADLTGGSLLKMNLGRPTDAAATGFVFDENTKLARVNFGGSNLNYIDLGGFDLSGSKWAKGTYTTRGGEEIPYESAATLKYAYLFNTRLNGADLTGADFSYASWFGPQATGEYAVAKGTNFTFADLPGINLRNASLQNAIFTDAVLVGAALSNVSSLDGATFQYADLRGADLTGTSLANASLFGATVANGPGTTTPPLQVLIDPDIKPNAYAFFFEDYAATQFTNTAGVKDCPDGSRTANLDCGPVTVDGSGHLSGYWLPPLPPAAPTGCTTDSSGNLNCTKRGRQ